MRLLPFVLVAALAAVPAASHASSDEHDAPIPGVVEETADLVDDVVDLSDADEAVEDGEAALPPTVVDVLVTLRDGTVAGSGRHEWADDENEMPRGYTLNRAGKKAAKKGRVKLRLKATVRYGDGTTEVVRETVWIGKAKAKARAKRRS